MYDNFSDEQDATRPRRLLPDAPTQNGACPVCGAEISLEHITSPAPRLALRAAIPQPIASAVLLVCTLSVRELAVFEFLGQGYDNRSIARELNVSERTVKRHVTAVLAKLRLDSRLQAGLAAFVVSSIPPTEVGTGWSEICIATDAELREDAGKKEVFCGRPYGRFARR